MPLIQSKSKKAFSNNVEKEMDAGKPQKQSLAIAYSVKRKNQRKKMASGGKIEHSARAEDDREPGMPAKKADDRRLNEDDYMSEDARRGAAAPARKADDKRPPMSDYMSNDMEGMYADGGEVTSKHNSPRPSQSSIESKDLNEMAPRGEMSHAQRAEYHEQEAAKYRMMAEGGLVGDGSRAQEDNNPGVPSPKGDNSRLPMSQYMSEEFDDGDSFPKGRSKNQRPSAQEMDSEYFADGGQVGMQAIMKENYKPKSMAEAIMHKRKKMADGGMVDIQENGDEEGSSPYDDMNSDATDSPGVYDDSQLGKQPEDSNEDGDDREDSRRDAHDMISQIRKKIKYKQSLG